MDEVIHNLLESFEISNSQTAVALSGGLDSVVLLHLVMNWTNKNYYPLPIALIVDHSLRSESEQEAKITSFYAKQLGIKSYVLKWETKTIKSNIQAQAREARYKLLTEWCTKHNVGYLFVGHHRDDQAETFLLRLERGSGLDGLSAMNYRSIVNNVNILRPLLDLSRSKIEQYAKFHKLEYIEDRSNQDLKYRRTLYRNLLNISDNKKTLVKRICLTALHMKRAMRALTHYTRLAFNECVNAHDLGYIEIRFNEFANLPEEIALRILLYSIMAMGNKYYKPGYHSIISVFEKIMQQDSNINNTLAGSKIKRDGKNILIIREASKIKELQVDLPLSKPVLWDNRFICTIHGGQKCSAVIAPLKKTQAIPKFLKDYNCCHEVFYSLPTLQINGKIIAYSHEACNSDIKTKLISSCTVKENLLYSTSYY